MKLQRRPVLRCLFLLGTLLLLPAVGRTQEKFPLQAKRILFVGDSITHAGQYVSWVETQLRLQKVDPLPEIINIGLGSETCSGLSEPDHPFPRPDVHERLERALDRIQPDVVVACYGMNDGIYYPFSEQRFEAYQQGVQRLIKQVQDRGAKIILMTPPPFDPLPLRDQGKLKPLGEEKYAYFAIYEDYDRVLAKYGEWILEQEDNVEMVIDLHGPITRFVREQREADETFSLTPDGIHPNGAGHRLIGNTILEAWGQPQLEEPPANLFPLVHQRSTLIHDAWLSAVGHKRPGVQAGLPLDEAEKQADELDQQINALIQ